MSIDDRDYMQSRAPATWTDQVLGFLSTAQGKVIAGRPYASVDDLLRVKGIGRKTLDEVRPYVKVAGDTEKRSQ